MCFPATEFRILDKSWCRYFRIK